MKNAKQLNIETCFYLSTKTQNIVIFTKLIHGCLLQYIVLLNYIIVLIHYDKVNLTQPNLNVNNLLNTVR